jgi:elongation factor P--(R)-beta-lysine ligase
VSHDFLPTAKLAILQHRARLLRAVRQFFDDRDYWELETPLLSHDIVVDAWLEPFVADWLPEPQKWAAGGQPLYLQTSPEFAMKRVLAAGATAVWQICKAFRNGEVGRRHNPEFTMLEWYRVGDDHHAQMQVTEDLVRSILQAGVAVRAESESMAVRRGCEAVPYERLTYDQAFQRHAGRTVLDATQAELAALGLRRGLVPPPGLNGDDRDGWLNFLLAELVEPHLGRDRPTFLLDYPASQAALAKTRCDVPGGPAIAERFELYIDGIELCNGYHELTDAAILRQRIEEQTTLRTAAGLRPLPRESRLLDVMEAGLPESSGVALGLDRLLMLALGCTSIDEVLAFPLARA